LLQKGTTGRLQATVQLPQFLRILNLDTDMVDTLAVASSGDCEVYARVVKHPLGVVRFEDTSGLIPTFGTLGFERR
jgi:hypothetical protein